MAGLAEVVQEFRNVLDRFATDTAAHSVGSVSKSVPNGAHVNEQLPFDARSVVVDNRTSSYLKVTAAGRWVDPGIGASFAINANDHFEIEWTAPPGKTQVPPVAGEEAQVVFYRDAVPPGSGVTSNQAVSTPTLPFLNVSGLSDLQGGVQVEGSAKFEGADPWYDVTHPHWGADPTGVADSRAPIQNAHDAAAVAGGEVFIPTGIFTCAGVQIPGQAAGIGAVFFPAPNVRVVGAGINSTFIKVQPGAAVARCDGFAFGFSPAGGNRNVSFFDVEDLTLDGTALGGVAFGSALRFANAALATGNDVGFRRLRCLNWRDWCISWGGFGVGNFQRLDVENVIGDGSVYGILWIGLSDWCTVKTLYGVNIAGHPATGEGCVLEVESGIWGDFQDIKGNNVPISILLISGILRANFDGIRGSCAAGADGVRYQGGECKFSNMEFLGAAGGGIGFHIQDPGQSVTGLAIDGLVSEGFTTDIGMDAFGGGRTLDGFTVTNAFLNSPTGFNNNSPITGFSMSASYFRGGSNRALSVQQITGVIEDCIFGVYTNAPFFAAGTQLEIHHCPGFNPVGAEVVGVPATGVAVAAVQWDRTYYVTAGAGGGVTMTIQNGPAVVIPANAVCAVRVPALKTVTPTYAAAPTWVVEGE